MLTTVTAPSLAQLGRSDINNVETFRAVSTKVGTPNGTLRSPFFIRISISKCCYSLMDLKIYTRSQCSFCEKLKTVLTMNNIGYTEYRLGSHFTREQFLAEFGKNSTFPRVIKDGKLIGGCTETLRLFLSEGLIKKERI